MPRACPQHCRNGKRHSGPISRRGLCSKCRRKILSDSGRPGGVKRKSFYKPPSRQPLARRWYMRAMRQSGSLKANTKKRQTRMVAPKSMAPADNQFTVDAAEYRRFLRHLDTFGKSANEVRYVADAVDVQIVKQWAMKTRDQIGTKMAVFGIVVMAHFNCLRTFGMVQTSFQSKMNWTGFRRALVSCGEKWGSPHRSKPSWVVYSPNCMSGTGLQAAGKSYLHRFPYHFRRVLRSKALADICRLIDDGISDASKAAQFRVVCAKLRILTPGLLGTYHYKMFHDFLVATGWFPPHLVT